MPFPVAQQLGPSREMLPGFPPGSECGRGAAAGAYPRKTWP